jgi:hypothetical protein
VAIHLLTDSSIPFVSPRIEVNVLLPCRKSACFVARSVSAAWSSFVTLVCVFATLAGAARVADAQEQSSHAVEQANSLKIEAQTPDAQRAAYLRLPMRFEPAAGQESTCRGESFVGYSAAYRVCLSRKQVAVELGRQSGSQQTAALRLAFRGANPHAQIRAEEKLPGVTSYFVGPHSSSWISGLPTYARVRYHQMYPGVDLAFYGNGDRLEYDLLVSPGASPAPLEMAISGSEPARVDRDGNLLLNIGGKSFELMKPTAYQPGQGNLTRREVAVRYELRAGADRQSAVRFVLGDYDRTRPLVIDPVLVYGSYLTTGSQQPNYAEALTRLRVDAAGNTYLLGKFPTGNTGAAFQVVKLNASGAILYTTSFGSSNSGISASDLAVDATGEVFVAGSAGANMPTTAGAFQAIHAGTSANAFLVKISAAGTQLLYASYLGGTGSDSAAGLAVDKAGKAYLTGSTSSADFPVTSGAYLTSSGITAFNNSTTSFAASFNPGLSGKASLVYSTYLVPSSGYYEGQSSGRSVAVDAKGEAVVATTGGTGSPVTNGAYYFSNGDQSGTYITKLNAAGSALVYSAFLGPGSVADMTLDAGANVYVTGSVAEDTFPTTAGAYNEKYAGGFASKLSADGTTLLYSTFLGGPSSYASNSVTPTGISIPAGCAANCAAIIAGTTTTGDFPLIQPVQNFFPTPIQTYPRYGSAGFLVQLSADATTATFSSYLSGATSTVDNSPTVALDSAGNAYVGLTLIGLDAPTAIAPPQVPYYGYNAPTYAYVAKISPANASLVLATPQTYSFGQHVVGVPAIVYSAPYPQVTIRNVGSKTATLKRPFTSSSSEFGEQDNCGTTLTAGAACTLQLTFTPATTGQRSAKLTIASDAPNSPLYVNVNGLGYNAAYITTSTQSVNFANQAVGTVSGVQTFTINNIGTLPFALGSLVIDDANNNPSSDFTQTSNCPAQLNAKSSCTVNVKFSPSQVGLRNGYVYTQSNGQFYLGVALNGNGIVSAARAGVLALSATSLNFGSSLVGSSTNEQQINILNSGSVPVTIDSIVASTTGQSGTSTVFTLGYTNCAYYTGSSWQPQTLAPQASCYIAVSMTPSGATTQTGTILITDSSAAGSHKVTLSGLGLAQTQSLVISPHTMTFPSQPVGVVSASQTFFVYNVGTAPVTIDRAYVTGDFQVSNSYYQSCEGTVLQGTAPTTSYFGQQSCGIIVTFTPTATGLRTGTLSLIDTASGTTQQFHLSGTGITASGTLVTGVSSLKFPAEPKGVSSAPQTVVIDNPGNTDVQLNSYTVTGDFTVDVDGYFCYSYPGTLPATIKAGTSCSINVVFMPTQSGGTETGTLTLHGSSGNVLISLSGTAAASTTAIIAGPPTLSLGAVAKGKTTSTSVYVQNTGTTGLTITGQPTITPASGTPAGDFTASVGNCGAAPQSAGTICYIWAIFTPTTTNLESATLSVTTSAGKETFKLTGQGLASIPPVTMSYGTLVFEPQVVGTSLYYYGGAGLVNNGTTAIKIISAKISAGNSDYVIPPNADYCTGYTVAPNSYCYVDVDFVPSALGLRNGTVTLTDQNNKTYSTALTGLAISSIDGASLSTSALTFPTTAVASKLNQQFTVTVNNSGNGPMRIGTLTGTDVAVSSSAKADFTVTNPCTTVIFGTGCSMTISFTPTAAGSKTGTLTIPVVYADKKTAALTVSLKGTATAEVDSVAFSPSNAYFPNEVAGLDPTTTYGPSMTFTLTNTGSNPVSLGALSGTNFSVAQSTAVDFTANGGYNQCYNSSQLAPGQTCTVQVFFLPRVAGTRTGSLSMPVTFADGKKSAATAALSGTAVAPTRIVAISPGNGQFNVEVAGTSDATNLLTFTLKNTGNAPVAVTGAAVNNANFQISSNACTTTIQPSGSCNVVVGFAPLASTAAGTITGTLTISSNATSGTHTATFSGTVLAQSQQLVLSQSSVSFSSEIVGASSSPVSVYLIDQNSSSQNVQIRSMILGGKNPADFQETQTCGGSLGFSLNGRTVCIINVAFAPAAGASGVRTASVTITPAQGTPLVLNLTGTAVPKTPAVALSPQTLDFGTASLGSRTAARTVSITNVGGAGLSITGASLSNGNLYRVASDACSGHELAPRATCTLSLQYLPSAVGSQLGSLRIMDNAIGAPHLVPLKGAGEAPALRANPPRRIAPVRPTQ